VKDLCSDVINYEHKSNMMTNYKQEGKHAGQKNQNSSKNQPLD
jgi:hypothetical protein